MANKSKDVPSSRSKAGRPPKYDTLGIKAKYNIWDKKILQKIDIKQKIYILASLGGSKADCARFAGITGQAISSNYRDIYDAGKADLKMRLRVAQLIKAYEGDTQMLKHLGCAHLEEQKDMQTIELSKDELKTGIEFLVEQNNIESKNDEAVND